MAIAEGDVAKAYGSTGRLKALWSFHAWTEVPGANKPRIFAKFRVIKNGSKSLLGHETASRMRLLKTGVHVNALAEEKEPEEFPSIPDFVLDFDIDPDVPPTKNAYVNGADGWALRLTRFDFNVEFVEGRNNIADPSSRLLDGTGEDLEDDAAPGEIMTLTLEEPGDSVFGR